MESELQMNKKVIGFLLILAIQIILILLVLDNLPKDVMRIVLLLLINTLSALALNKLSKTN